MGDLLTITVIGWKKFNGRGDVKNPTWFRVEYRLLDDPEFFHFNHGEFKAWLYVLAQACRKGAEKVRISLDHAFSASRISKKDFRSSLKKLEQLQLVLVDVTDAYADVTDAIRDRQTDRTDRQDRHATSPLAAVKLAHPALMLPDGIDLRPKAVDGWATTYPVEWLNEEFRKAMNWCAANPDRTPKSDWTKFFNGWFVRGWETYRKTLPSNAARKSIEDILGIPEEERK